MFSASLTGVCDELCYCCSSVKKKEYLVQLKLYRGLSFFNSFLRRQDGAGLGRTPLKELVQNRGLSSTVETLQGLSLLISLASLSHLSYGDPK